MLNVSKNISHPRMVLSGIHSFKVWIPDYTLGNDRVQVFCFPNGNENVTIL